MKCFGFILTLEGEIADGRWRDRADHKAGRICRVLAQTDGYEITYIVYYYEADEEISPRAKVVWPADGVLEELTHKYPKYAPGPASGGSICHELRFPDVGSPEADEKRVSALPDIDEFNRDFVGEIDSIGVQLIPYEECIGPTEAGAHRNLCAVLPNDDPLLICAVCIGEKAVPWLRALG